MEYALALIRPFVAERKSDIVGRLAILAILYGGIVYNPYQGVAAAGWWLAICLGCSALSWLMRYRVLGFLCAYMILPVFAGTGYGIFRALGLAP